MKKYMHYKVGLLIGLFSLNILSSCVHTGQTLCLQEHKSEPNCIISKLSKNFRCKGIKTMTYLMVAGLVVAGIVVRLMFRIPHLISQANRPNRHSSGRLMTDIPFMPTEGHTSTMPYPATYRFSTDAQQAQFIIGAVQRNPADLVTNEAPDDRVMLRFPMRLHKEIVKDLQKNNFSIKRIEYWLVKGLNIDAKDVDRGYTLLMYAVAYRKRVVQFIIDKGANVNAHAKDRRTPLHLAVGHHRLAVVKYLLRAKNIDLNALDKRNRTPIDLANKKSIYLAMWSRYPQEQQKVR